MLYVRSSTGKLVSLNTIAKAAHHGVGPLAVNHLGQLPSVTVSFNLEPGVSLGDAFRSRRAGWRGTPCRIPSRDAPRRGGSVPIVLRRLGLCCWWRVLVIYMVLGILYESFIHPITILSGLPSAGMGALATLLLFHD